jgi:hypothetical protein
MRIYKKNLKLFLYFAVAVIILGLLMCINYREGYIDSYERINNKKQSILIILSSHEMTQSYIPNIKVLSDYIKYLSQDYRVDLAGISNTDDFDNYSKYLNFDYKYISTKKQLSKICDFITDTKKYMNYNWYIKTRPDILILDFIMFNPKNFDKHSIHARAREYEGPRKGKYICSVGGDGAYKYVHGCSSNINTKEKIVLDDQVYMFHKNIIDKGGFNSINNIKDDERQDEWFHTKIWSERSINLNIIPLNMKFKHDIYSGDIN